MAIIVKNIITKSDGKITDVITPPANPVPEKVQVTLSYDDLRKKASPKAEPAPKPEENVPVRKREKYIKVCDGELVKHINRKSPYLTDMLELDSENT